MAPMFKTVNIVSFGKLPVVLVLVGSSKGGEFSPLKTVVYIKTHSCNRADELLCACALRVPSDPESKVVRLFENLAD